MCYVVEFVKPASRLSLTLQNDNADMVSGMENALKARTSRMACSRACEK